MANYRKRLLGVTTVAAMTAVLAACGGGSDSDGSSPSSDNTSSGDASGAAQQGGTLNYYMDKPLEHLDPQRVYVGRDISNLSRTVYRSLVTFPMSEDATEGNTPVADLATDTGTSTEGGKVWQFTLRDGIKWEDGSDITCEDFRYGASRVYAADVITGGPNYITTYLDLPTDADGNPDYPGPYTATEAQQTAFDNAITCDGKTITYHFSKPWPDFPLAIAALHMMDPYKQSFDTGDGNNLKILSSGPYKLDGEWTKETGGTLVRNDQYDASTDETNSRAALPDEIVFKIGQPVETIYDQLISDSDQTAITGNRVPPADYSQLQGAVLDRYYTIESPYVDYLVPNFKSPRMADVKVRQALAAATNINAWITAGGGEKAYKPAESIVNPAVVGYQDNPAFSGSNDGDVDAAKQLLAEAGVTTPYKIKFTYPQSETADKQAAALKQTWDEAGFEVTLDPLGDTYYDVIMKPNEDSDIYWAGWGADWPSAITVTAPLFDSRPNLSKGSNGNDYGAYESDAANAAFDKAYNATTLDEQTAALQDADTILGEDVAYIPLEIAVFNFLYGSKVAGFTTTPSSNGFPDLGAIGVNQ
ncbi:ABC transporter substrate-binding protein [Nocardioides sp.]|uniref:ABC transporter substrate-binding protein n=1 Tax=Nocardioides sp. TaxID=35761 RepID=UPI0039E448AA